MTSPCPLPLMPNTDWQATTRYRYPANRSGFMMCPWPQRSLAQSMGTVMAPCQLMQRAQGNRCMTVYRLALGLLKALALAWTCPFMTSRNPAQICNRKSEDSAPLAFMTSLQDRSNQRCPIVPLYPKFLCFPEVPQLLRSLCIHKQCHSLHKATCRWNAGQAAVRRTTIHAAGSPVGDWALYPCWRRAVAEGCQRLAAALPARPSLTANESARPPPPQQPPAPPLARVTHWPSAHHRHQSSYAK